MALFDRFWKGPRARADRGRDDVPAGFYPLYESMRPIDDDDDDAPRPRVSAKPDFDAWDARLDHIDAAVEVEERRRRRWWQRDYWRARSKLWWTGRGILASLALFVLLIGWLATTAPLSKSLEPIAPPQVTLLASDGTPIARSGAVVEAPVKVADLPPHVSQAFIAIEDRRFYTHWGIDPRSIARAVWTGYGGGSTITQQLAKFTFLTPEQSLSRKAREALIAFWLEGWLTKDEILERYLSNAYFGLAGLLQAPSRYAPTRHYDKARARMDLVVGAMVEEGYLTAAEAKALPDPRIDVRTRDDNLPTGTYFADWALPLAREGMEASYSRQVLTTTLDARLQSLANRVVARAPLGGAQVALVAMRRNGEVVAMVGGRDYGKSSFNRVTQARRQPGSTFKTFVYLAALEAGWEPDDTIPNTEITQGSYRPKNAAGRYSDQITLEDAFARSSNVAAFRLFQAVGSDKVIAQARALGITAPMAEGDPSLALGTSVMTLMELTAAYAGIAANEFPVEPHAFPRGTRTWWEWLTTRKDSLSSRTHKDLETMLRAAINRGTGRNAVLPIANYGKTGTSQDYRDALFVGYAGDLVVGVWIGNDDNTPMKGVTGGSTPARIWRDFMRGALKIEAAPQPEPSESPDPEGPIQQFDIEGGEIPLGENGATLRIDRGGVVIAKDGVPVEVRLGEGGVVVQPAPTPAAPPPS